MFIYQEAASQPLLLSFEIWISSVEERKRQEEESEWERGKSIKSIKAQTKNSSRSACRKEKTLSELLKGGGNSNEGMGAIQQEELQKRSHWIIL